MSVKQFVSSVDFTMLMQQKLTLLNLVYGYGEPKGGDMHLAKPKHLSKEQVADIDGLIHFIDAFQDYVVENKLKSEDEVYRPDTVHPY